jgi:HK97 gp10 family phage protein
MGDFSYNLKGFSELNARLADLAGKQATSAGQSAIRAGGVVLRDAVKAKAPVGPTPEGAKEKHGDRTITHHKIAEQITVTKVKSPNEHQVSVAVHNGKAFHASWVEFGSIHNQPNPFFLNALNDVGQEVIDKVGATLGKQLTKRGV